MQFTQFIFPNGSRKPVSVDVSPELEILAQELIDAGWNFEIECFPDTQVVNMDCCNNEQQLSCRICKNGPQVPVMIEELVKDAHKRFKQGIQK